MPCCSQLATFLYDSQLGTPFYMIILPPTLIDIINSSSKGDQIFNAEVGIQIY